MQLFSTMLNINDNLTVDAFLRLVIEWNQSSLYEENVIPEINWNGERNIRFGDDRLWLAFSEYPKQDITAVRYEKQDADGIIWDSDYILNSAERRLAIRLDRSYTEDALSYNPSFSTPFFIRLLIERGYVRDDGCLPVSTFPTEIDTSNGQILAGLAEGSEHFQLPVVYVSKMYDDTNPLDTGRLAYRLKGAAHVLVQQSISLNGEIREPDEESYGTVSIYFPNTACECRRYHQRNEEDADLRLLDRTVRAVIQYNNTQVVPLLYTWQGVSNAILRDSLTEQAAGRAAAEEERRNALYEILALKSSLLQVQEEMQQWERESERAKSEFRKKALEEALGEADKLIEAFDGEMREKQARLEKLTSENDRLAAENAGLRSKLAGMEAEPILFAGDEREFFPGEIQEIILKALIDTQKKTEEKTRRSDVLKDIIDRNGPYRGTLEKEAEQVKKLLNGYRNLTGEMKRALQDMGMVITEEGKHYKLTYFGDGRYSVTLGKTPSDFRGGMNDAMKIKNKML